EVGRGGIEGRLERLRVVEHDVFGEGQPEGVHEEGREVIAGRQRLQVGVEVRSGEDDKVAAFVDVIAQYRQHVIRQRRAAAGNDDHLPGEVGIVKVDVTFRAGQLNER